jgi:hypothetical protein
VNDPALEQALEELPDGGGPREGWQETVLARLELAPAPARRARWPLVVAGSGVMAAAVVVFVALRAPHRAPADRAPVAPAAGSPTLEDLEHTVDRIEARVDDAYDDLLSARTEAERLEVEQALKESARQLEAVKRQLERARRKWPRVHDGKLTVKCEPDDPLCAIN